MQSVVQTLFAAAVDDGVITANPADRLGRSLKLGRSVAARQDTIKAMTRAQLASLLAAAERVVPRLAALLLLLARTGLRLGEALALQWRDIDYTDRVIHVARAFSGGRLETPKSGAGRTVDLSQQLCDRSDASSSCGRPRPCAAGGRNCRPGCSARARGHRSIPG
jgi:integrase